MEATVKPDAELTMQLVVNMKAEADRMAGKSQPRFMFFVIETEMRRGEYVACVATEGDRGYQITDWTWGSDWEIANKIANDRNARMGIDEHEAMKIQLRTMRK